MDKILDMLKSRLQLEEALLNRISRFLMALEQKQPGAVRNYRNVCLNPSNPNMIIVVFEDQDNAFAREFPADLVDAPTPDAVSTYVAKLDEEEHKEYEKRAEEWERKVYNTMKKKYGS